jgi:hypothetical protein
MAPEDEVPTDENLVRALAISRHAAEAPERRAVTSPHGGRT